MKKIIKAVRKTMDYNPSSIEKKWQRKWQSSNIYKTKEDNKKPKYYVLDMFPYPSGEGLHVGHPKGYIATDIISRYKRMTGHSVLHPMGFDAFGLPAENYALKTKTNPADSVKKNVARYKKQLEILGFDYDWAREVNTTDPKYYKWTQWIFLKLLEKGLAYESYEPINWCPSCKTGLANEDVEDGRCERCGTVVEKKPMRQWVLKITDYAERLLSDLDLRDVNQTLLEVSSSGEPCFMQVIEPGTIRKDLPFVERKAITAIVKHWSEDKYIGLVWKKVPWKTFITGGVEKGQSVEEAAFAEVREETGYQNIKFVKNLGKVNSKFFHVPKGENRFAHFDVLYLELKDGEKIEVSEKEKANHDVVWVSKEEVKSFITPEAQKYMWSMFVGESAKFIDNARRILDWPESIKILQKNWIGKSEGALIKFKIQNPNDKSNSKSETQKYIEVFTTRIDTIFSGTFVVVSPEHKIITELGDQIANIGEVKKFIDSVKNKSEADRLDKNNKDGIRLEGVNVINPATGEEIQVWVSDFVLGDYGTGAVFADAHDQRDFDIAKKYGIPLKVSIKPENDNSNGKYERLEECFEGEGILINSGQFDGLKSVDARPKIIAWLAEKGLAKPVTKYKLRDWVFSRQRYWGEPIPVIHCENCKLVRLESNGIVPVPEKDLPVILPKVKSYEPTGTGESPLAAITKWVNVKCPVCKSPAKRETNTMPQWAGSSWYYLRYLDPKNNKVLASKKTLDYWCGDKDDGVDLYVGGAEHATRHLIYARFWHKFLYDIGVVSNIEPFLKLQHVGLIMGEDGRKMSKRFGNVINPDEIVKNYGADSLRLYEMFMGPFDQQIAWSTNSISGVRRFIEKVWRLREKVWSINVKIQNPNDKIDKIIHKTIKKVTEDIENMRYNTAISSMMIAINEIEKAESITRGQYENILKLLAPFAPHFTEELWVSLGNKKSIHVGDWPQFDSALVVDDEVNIMVQVNGKVRGSFTSPADADNASLEAKAKEVDEVKKWLDGKTVVKVIVVPKRLVNIVVA